MKCPICNKGIWWWQKSKFLTEDIARHWFGTPAVKEPMDSGEFLAKLQELYLTFPRPEYSSYTITLQTSVDRSHYHLKCLNEKVCGEI